MFLKMKLFLCKAHIVAFICAIIALHISACLWEETENNPDYLPLDDSMYPYAELPRIVIETKNFRELRNRETKVPAKLQIYGKESPTSEVLELTVRGRGNSSFGMSKYGMKLEFANKIALFGMPKNRDWALVANYGDKTHLRNYMAYRLSNWLNADYTPRGCFVELYFNRKYMGLYLLVETIKVSKYRVNITEDDTTFLVEKEDPAKYDDPYIITPNTNYIYHIKSPHNVTDFSKELLLNHLSAFDDFLFTQNFYPDEAILDWIDLDDYLLYYWVQEYSKNEDGAYSRSIYFSWKKGEPIHFGPLWDFDLSFGNQSLKRNKPAENWYVRTAAINYYIFENSLVKNEANLFWQLNKNKFKDLIDSVSVYRTIIEHAIHNEYKRWPIMSNTENWALKEPYDSYDDAINAMIEWMQKRYNWIDAQVAASIIKSKK